MRCLLIALALGGLLGRSTTGRAQAIPPVVITQVNVLSMHDPTVQRRQTVFMMTCRKTPCL